MIKVPIHIFQTEEILNHLRKDPILSTIITDEPLKERITTATVYEYLIRAINFQQLSGKAAAKIHHRFLDLFPDRFADPFELKDMDDQLLRSAGLSRQKASYVRNVANYFIDHQLINKEWHEDTDEEILKSLTSIKGVGNWTVEMVLIFCLCRLDVFPLDDLVIKNNVIKLYQLDNLKGRTLNKKILSIADQWKPYRTTASLYLWNWTNKGIQIDS